MSYTLANYQTDKEKKARATMSNQLSGLSMGGSVVANLRPSYTNGGYAPYVEGLSSGYVTPNAPTPVTPSTTPVFGQQTQPTSGAVISRNPSTVTPVGNTGETRPVTNTGSSAGSVTETETGTGTESVLTEKEVNSAIVTSDTKNKMDTSLQGLIAMAQRGFKYNEKESPLYAILQKQMADEARLASGRAYSRAVANAGGFGSSYATLAAEEASRQVMEGWDEQQLALYQAAKEEWDSKFQSKLDEYNLLSTQYQQEKAEKNEADSLFASAVSALRTAYGVTYDEAAMTADLRAMGLNDEQIARALANQKQYSDAMASSSLTAQSAIEALRGKYGEDEYNEEQMTLYLQSLGYGDESIKGALDYWSQYKQADSTGDGSETISGTAQDALAEWQAENDSAYSPDLMRAFFEGRGYEADVINEAMTAQRNIARGVVLDMVISDAESALEYGVMLNNALAGGVLTDAEYKEAQAKNSAIIQKDTLRRLNKELTDDQADALVKKAAEYVADGLMTVDDFKEILTSQTEQLLETMKTDAGDEFNTLGEVKDLIVAIQGWTEYRDNGAITDADIINALASMRDNETLRAVYEKIHRISIYGKDNTVARFDDDENEAMLLLFSALDPYCTWDSRRECTWKTES